MIKKEYERLKIEWVGIPRRRTHRDVNERRYERRGRIVLVDPLKIGNWG